MATKSKKTDAKPSLKFVKNAFYEDAKGNLWQCVNGKTRKSPDGNVVVDMKATKDGHPIGEAGEEYTDTFVKKLTTAELKEIRDVAQREAEGLADAAVLNATETTGKKGKAKKVTEATTTTEPGDAPPVTKKEKKPKAEKEPGKMSALDAAAKVLGEAGQPMAAKEMIDAMATKGYWTSPGGKTPHATLYAAILREVTTKGAEARFVKTDRGKFGLVAAPASK